MTSGGSPYGGPCAVPPPERGGALSRLVAGVDSSNRERAIDVPGFVRRAAREEGSSEADLASAASLKSSFVKTKDTGPKWEDSAEIFLARSNIDSTRRGMLTSAVLVLAKTLPC